MTVGNCWKSRLINFFTAICALFLEALRRQCADVAMILWVINLVAENSFDVQLVAFSNLPVGSSNQEKIASALLPRELTLTIRTKMIL